MSTNVMSTSGSARPILFSSPMVRALLDGRKTQTRRIMKPQPITEGCEGVYPDLYNHGPQWAFWLPDNRMTEPRTWTCPYGKPGDRLWVREAWKTSASMDSLSPKRIGEAAVEVGYKEPWAPLTYLADGQIVKGDVLRPGEGFGRYRHARFMPRWASRITLEIAEVRVQRLQEISVEDAEAEGLSCVTKDGSLCKYGIADLDGLPGNDDSGWPWHRWRTSPVDAYWQLWMDINGADSWNANPWVWALTFRAASPGDKPEEQSHV